MQKIIYDEIGTTYNGTRQADPYLTSRLIYLLQPTPGKLYLDIGCGTGNYTIALADKGINLYGVEPSEMMLGEARSRNQKITWLLGTAENIPVIDDLFDGAIATLTIHHWKDLNKAFNELKRVLKDSGEIVIFTSTPEQMEGYWLNHYFPEMLKQAAIQMPSLALIEQAFIANGFEIKSIEKYNIQDNLQDGFLYIGKNNPQLYFDENIRAGISAFAALANKDEIRSGLLKLHTDLQNDTFKFVKEHYKNDIGEYLFITLMPHNQT